MKEEARMATTKKKTTNEERFNDLTMADNETEKRRMQFYPVVLHNKKQETAELRLL